MGVGAEGEACVVVAQHTADGFDIDSILEGYGGKGMSEAMERDVLQIGILENFLVELRNGVGVVHFTSGWGWEHVRLSGCLLCSWIRRFTASWGMDTLRTEVFGLYLSCTELGTSTVLKRF